MTVTLTESVKTVKIILKREAYLLVNKSLPKTLVDKSELFSSISYCCSLKKKNNIKLSGLKNILKIAIVRS